MSDSRPLQPLPELPPSLSRLRSHSAASSTVAHHSILRPTVVAAPATVLHRRVPSDNSSSPALSRRPSLAHRPSLALLSESVPLRPPVARESARLHSIASSLSIGANRNAVYIDSAQVSSRLDEWLTSAESVPSSVPPQPHAPPPNTPMTPYLKPLASSSQIYLGPSPLPKRAATVTDGFVPAVTPSRSPRVLGSQPSLVSLSQHVLSPKLSASSIGLAYQDVLPPQNFYPSPPTASRWSLTSSVAENMAQDKKKEKTSARKRLASLISRFTGYGPNKEAKQQQQQQQQPELTPPKLDPRQRSVSNASVNPPPKMKSKSKPPSLKLDASMAFPRSPTISSSTSTHTNVPSKVTSPVVPSFTPISSPSPVKASFPSTRMSVSTSTTSTNTASPLMPTTPVLADPLLALSPALKSAISVPVLSPAYDGPGFIRRDDNYRGNLSDHVPLSRSRTYGDDELDAAAEYYARHVTQTTAEDERRLRLGVITDMLDRDLNGVPQPSRQVAPEPPSRPQGPINQSRDHGRFGVVDKPSHSSPTSPLHLRQSSNRSRSSSPIQRSVSGPHASSLNVSTPPLPTRNGFRGLAARMGIANSPPTSQSLTSPDSKRKSLARLMSNSKRKAGKRRLVISGVGDQQEEVDALTEWCTSIGEVRTMVKVRDLENAIIEGIVAADGLHQDVWIVDYKKSSVVESVSGSESSLDVISNMFRV